MNQSLKFLQRYADHSDFLLRLLVGSFLMWGTWDNMVSSERMAEFANFMAQFGFPAPAVLAPFSVWAQFIGGALLVLGWQTRWVGLVMALHFLIAWLMVHLGDDFRGQFPALVLIALSLHWVTRGAGRYSIDAVRGPSNA